ncbi:MAG: helix-turn-helix transcriptional regulator [Chlorobi bacterium]|nr:helix-turn-helix transcriptional regulator [Chlorobiota bacterium]
MVCPRCIKVVSEELEKLEIKIKNIKLGEVDVVGEIDKKKLETLQQVLQENGFELIDDRKSRLIESVKNIVIETIHYDDLSEKNIIWSELISKELNFEYKYLSQLFSSVEGITIEHYIILQKIEKAKELIVYNEFTLSEIAWKLGYSSVAHLSNQFKKITGMTPKNFKQLGKNKRKSLDKV